MCSSDLERERGWRKGVSAGGGKRQWIKAAGRWVDEGKRERGGSGDRKRRSSAEGTKLYIRDIYLHVAYLFKSIYTCKIYEGGERGGCLEVAVVVEQDDDAVCVCVRARARARVCVCACVFMCLCVPVYVRARR